MIIVRGPPTASGLIPVRRLWVPPAPRKVRKSTFKVSAPKAVATGFEGRDGKACVVVWQGLLPVWDGEFGRLVAKRVK